MKIDETALSAAMEAYNPLSTGQPDRRRLAKAISAYLHAAAYPALGRAVDAARAMDEAFGMGINEAHDILRENAGAKRIYDCAMIAISALSSSATAEDEHEPAIHSDMDKLPFPVPRQPAFDPEPEIGSSLSYVLPAPLK